MVGVVEHGAAAGDVAGHAGRGLVLRAEDRLDAVRLVGLQPLGIELERHAGSPFAVDDIDLEAETFGHVDPQMRELAEARHQHAVAGAEHIGHRRFPGAGAGGGVDEDAAGLVLEDFFDVFEQRQGEIGKDAARMSSIGRFIACRTCSGMLVGPGMKRWVKPAMMRTPPDPAKR